jgi:hypothetical protein
MVVTEYICDRCQNKIERVPGATNPLNAVSIAVKKFVAIEVEWCRKCCIETGLISNPSGFLSTEEAKLPIQPPPTFEDLLREIIQEEAREVATEVVRDEMGSSR